MANYYLSPVGNNSQVGTNGAPLSGGTISAYQAGTSTPVATYTDNTGVTPQTWPITLNTYGQPSSPIWLKGGQAVKFVIKDSLGNTIRTIDSVSGVNDPTAGAAWSLGQCRLAKSGANLVLSPYQGNQITIAGINYTIPAAGVSLSAAGLTASTLYYIYAWMNGANMALEASTTGHSTDPTTGAEIKNGDNSRTLVGMARPIAGPAWQDTAAQRFVVSYFNRRPINGSAAFTANRTTTSVSYTEINAEIRNEFLAWNDSAVDLRVDGSGTNGTAGNVIATSIGIDSTTTAQEARSTCAAFTANLAVPISCSTPATLNEGYHFATLLGSVDGGTGTWVGSATAGARVSLKSIIQG